MIGEKDKQIKEVQGKYAASAAYKLQEKLQESMEALEVMANLQAEQLQYMEDHARCANWTRRIRKSPTSRMTSTSNARISRSSRR